MNCEDHQDNIYLHAAGALEHPELAKLQAHLATGCPPCTGKLAEAQATVAQLPLALERYSRAPATALSKLHAKLDDADQVAEPEKRLLLRPEPARNFAWGYLAAAAAIAIAITAGVMLGDGNAKLHEAQTALARLQTDRDKLQADSALAASKLASAEKSLADINTALTALEQKNKQLDSDLVAARTDLAATQEVAKMLASKNLLMLDLKTATAGAQGPAQARLLVDLQNKIWRLYTADLKPVPNKVFEFWLITADGAKVPMGSFTTDAAGQGTLTGTVPDPMPQLAMAAITDEPGPGAKQPTGTMQVAGKFQ